MDRLTNNLSSDRRRPVLAGFVLAAWTLALVGGSSHLASAERPRSSEAEIAVTPAAVDPAPPFVPELRRANTGRLVEMEVTAYCACTKCCGPNAQGITASGKLVDYNAGKFIAADTTLLPFGTKVSIPGYHGGEAVEVIDRGGAIKGNKLDVFFPSHDEALEWGRRTIAVWIDA